MLRSRAPVLLALLSLLFAVACNSPGASSPAAGDGDGNGDGQSSAAEATSMPGEATSTPADSGGGGSTDVAAVFDQLVPPNATQTTRTDADGIIFAVWESTDSIDSLRSHYEGAFGGAGLRIITTTQSNGGYAWAVATDESGTFGGSVVILPSTSGGSGTTVSVTIGESG